MSDNLPVLAIVAVMEQLRVSDHTCLVCSGAKGYRALKELLQSGTWQGDTMLLESCDIESVEEGCTAGVFIGIHSVGELNKIPPYLSPEYNSRLQTSTATHLTVYARALPEGFLQDCTGLTTLDLAPLSNVKRLPEGFLRGCSGLASLDLAPLSQLTWIPEGFLQDCTGLKTLNLGFLRRCSGLATLVFAPLNQLTCILGDFLQGCTGLKTLDLDLVPFSNKKQRHMGFLQGCSGLTSLDLTPLSHLTELPEGFLWGCSGLTSLNLAPLSHLSELPEGFLEGCSGLKTLDFSPLSNLTELPYGFLEGCTGILTLNMSPILNVTGESLRGYLSGCIHLESIILSSSHDDRMRTDIANSMPNITIVYV